MLVRKLLKFPIIGLVTVFLALLFQAGSVQAEYQVPTYVGHVNDFENIIDNDPELETKLAEYKASTTVEIAVLTVNSFSGDDIAPYSNKVFRAWGLGDKEKNNGLLIIVSKEQRKSRIEVGYGLEYVLTDPITGRIQDTYMVPSFKEEKYSDGINAGVQAILDILNDKLDPNTISGSTESEDVDSTIAAIIQVFFFMVFFFGGVMAKTKSWWLGGVLGGVVGLVSGQLIGGSTAGWLSPTIGILVGLGLDYFLSKLPPGTPGARSNGMAGWFIGSSLGSHSGSSGGGGGFGGFGGGSSGGGGSSRGW